MQITLETDYAVRCLVYLKGTRDKISVLGEISEGTKIPPAFLSKILQKMIKHGLVKSTKGKKGGFTLSKAPDKISVYNIMQAVCGCETVMKVVCSKSKEPCVFLKSCKIHAVWQDLGKVLRGTLEAKTLAQL